MGNKNRSNVLLVEILIAVFFFMISATVLVRVFATSKTMTTRSGVETLALTEAQNVAETLYAADDPEASLAELSFRSSHGAWSRDYGDFTLYVTGSLVPAGADEMWQGEVSAFYKQRNTGTARLEDEEMFTLSCTRYEGVRS